MLSSHGSPISICGTHALPLQYMPLGQPQMSQCDSSSLSQLTGTPSTHFQLYQDPSPSWQGGMQYEPPNVVMHLIGLSLQSCLNARKSGQRAASQSASEVHASVQTSGPPPRPIEYGNASGLRL